MQVDPTLSEGDSTKAEEKGDTKKDACRPYFV